MKRRNILLLVIMLAIGFAAVSTTLILNGTIGIGAKIDDFDVIFVETLLNGEKSKNVSISEDKKSITFKTDRLREVNEKAKLDYKIKNNSTQYGANVTISCNTTGNEYLSITGEFNGETLPIEVPIEMEAQEIKDGFISAEIVKAYAGENSSIELICEIIATSTSKEEEVDFVPYNLYKEDILNGADPVLTSSSKIRSVSKNLIPVTIANDGTVTYANIENKWYDYENKEWANAIFLIDNPSKKYRVNDEIKEEDIESYFVWIPKYSYQLWDLGEYNTLTEIDKSKPHVIPVRFGTSNTSDNVSGECTTPGWNEDTQSYDGSNVSGNSGNCEIGDYMTAPAFLSMGTNGLWVGKFETGYKGATTDIEARINEADSTKVQIKPNVYSWIEIKLANAHLTSYNYSRKYDSHLMKNTEWGAIAYLQHSKYGSATSVRINNNNKYITGYAATNEPESGLGAYSQRENTALGVDGIYTINYKNPDSQNASTTGNYSGIYDMSGGAFEYTLALMKDNENNIISGRDAAFNTGFSGKYVDSTIITDGTEVPDIKYLDVYKIWNNRRDYSNSILGDAAGETGPYAKVVYGSSTRYISSWYDDEANVSLSTSIGFGIRGGNCGRGSGAGIFASDDHNVSNSYLYGFRIVLAP